MARLVGNSVRQSTAPIDAEVINNFPGRYPTEDWQAHYWVVSETGDLTDRRVIIQLPRGFTDVCQEVYPGQKGCIHRARRWGVACYTSLLGKMGFDPDALLARGQETPGGEGQEILRVMIQATHFDLPGHFLIASWEYPFSLFDPEGMLKGSYTIWCTYLGALAWLVTAGTMSTDFELLEVANPELYRESVDYLLSALRGQSQ